MKNNCVIITELSSRGGGGGKNLLPAVRNLLVCAAAAGAMAVAAVSCEKGGDDSKEQEQELGTYTPNTNDDLRQLIVDANAKLYAERQVSLISIVGGVREEIKMNANTKKLSLVDYENGKVEYLYYLEGDKAYRYDQSETPAKYILRPTTDADKMYMFGGDLNIQSYDNDTYRLAGSKIEVTNHYGGGNVVYEVVLTADKRYKSMVCTEHFDRSDVVGAQTTFSYTASPALPNGFSKSDFVDKLSDYLSARMVWGEGKGENTFWYIKQTESNAYSVFQGKNLVRFAPDVAGKVIDYFTVDSSDTHYCAKTNVSDCGSLPNDILLSNTGGMVIRAVWKNN